ncbi:hypothetical protein GBA52_011860 [Prunus armeniaca]|nr:hypothetical protein GBA52_011860 [Prunus armeniaca]
MEGKLVFSDRAPVINSMLRTSDMWVQNARRSVPLFLHMGSLVGPALGLVYVVQTVSTKGGQIR